MKKILECLFYRSRATLMGFFVLLVLGISSYINISREINPDIQIPLIVVSVTMHGVSALEAEKFLLKPMEEVLRSVKNTKKINSVASEGRAYVTLEFIAGSEGTLEDVRSKIDDIVNRLPDTAERPDLKEINLGLLPVISIAISGDVPERTLIMAAKQLKKKIESLPDVLEVNAMGVRDEIVDISIDPGKIISYDLQPEKIQNLLFSNNQLVDAGDLEGGFGLEASGTIKNVLEIYEIPIYAHEDGSIVSLSDVADISLILNNNDPVVHLNGKPAIVLEISKRLGSNMIQVSEKVRKVVDSYSLLNNIEKSYISDQSEKVMNMLRDLENSIILTILLVMLIICLFVSLRQSILIAVSIPCSFIISILVIDFLGLTLNLVVLFSLIMSVGMLVDSAIIVNEYADRRLFAGMSRVESYKEASTAMFIPIVSSTLTTIVVFSPLLFWPGVVGEFMKYLPITVIITLSVSIAVSLLFMPVMGGIIGSNKPLKDCSKMLTDVVDFDALGPYLKRYYKALSKALDNSKKVVVGTILFLITVICLYSVIGKGLEFFPYVEPERAFLTVTAKGNMSTKDKEAVMGLVEEKILDLSEEVKSFYSSMENLDRESDPVIVKIALEFSDWKLRRKSKEILLDIRQRVSNISGFDFKVTEEKPGPSSGKPIKFYFFSLNDSTYELDLAKHKVMNFMNGVQGLLDISDNSSSSELKWSLQIDKHKASKLGTNVLSASSYIKMATDRGVYVGKYRPDDHDEEIDMLIRFPESRRNIKTLENLLINSSKGLVPLSDFVNFAPIKKIERLDRINGNRVFIIDANVEDGYLVNDKIKEIKNWINKNADLQTVSFNFEGESEDQEETQVFLSNAFILAIVLMVFILVCQFNSFYKTFVVMSSIVLSTAGVFLGLILTNQAFGVIMCGIGIITLSGVVVNNNILLIDAFDINIAKGMKFEEAILSAALARVRPILLTAGTTVIGLLPMAFGISIDFFNMEISYDAPSTQWWTQLSASIAGGLSFATVVTLFFTPTLLKLFSKVKFLNSKSIM